jgi:hypothetical protein
VLDAIGQNYQPVEHLCMNGFYYHILWPHRRLAGYPGFSDEPRDLAHARFPAR